MRFTRKDGLIYGVGTLGFGKYDTVTNSFAYKSWFTYWSDVITTLINISHIKTVSYVKNGRTFKILLSSITVITIAKMGGI